MDCANEMTPSPGTLGEPDASGGTDIPERIFCKSDSWIGTTLPAPGVVLLLSLLAVLPRPDSEKPPLLVSLFILTTSN